MEGRAVARRRGSHLWVMNSRRVWLLSVPRADSGAVGDRRVVAVEASRGFVRERLVDATQVNAADDDRTDAASVGASVHVRL